MADDTRKECMRLFDTREYYFIWLGACRLAQALIDLIGDMKNDRKINNTKFIKNTLDFLLKSKSDMLTYILNSGQDGITFKIAPVRNKGKSTKECKPYKLIYSDSTTPEDCGTEFISEEEHKWRDTARILMDAVSAANVAPVVHGKMKKSGEYTVERYQYKIVEEKCSVCEHYSIRFKHKSESNFCSRCGAKMDEEVKYDD